MSDDWLSGGDALAPPKPPSRVFGAKTAAARPASKAGVPMKATPARENVLASRVKDAAAAPAAPRSAAALVVSARTNGSIVSSPRPGSARGAPTVHASKLISIDTPPAVRGAVPPSPLPRGAAGRTRNQRPDAALPAPRSAATARSDKSSTTTGRLGGEGDGEGTPPVVRSRAEAVGEEAFPRRARAERRGMLKNVVALALAGKGKVKSGEAAALPPSPEEEGEEEGEAPFRPSALLALALRPELRRDAAARVSSLGVAYKRLSVMPGGFGARSSGGLGRMSTVGGLPAPFVGGLFRRPSLGEGSESPTTTVSSRRRRGGAFVRDEAMLGLREEQEGEEEEEEEASAEVPPPAPDAVPSSVPPGLALALAPLMAFLSTQEALGTAARVATAWRDAAVQSVAWRVATDLPRLMEARAAGRRRKGKRIVRIPTEPVLHTSLPPFLAAFPWGRFLSSGAYKDVYAVWNAGIGRLEALSVMDADALAESGALPVVAAEVQCAVLLAGLVRAGVCPHFIETHAVFLHACRPSAGAVDDGRAWTFPSHHWGGPGTPPNPARNPFKARAEGGPQTAGEALPVPSVQRVGKGGKGRGDTLLSPILARLQAATAGSGPATPPEGAAAPPARVYIRMELCTGGDAEEALRRVEGDVAAAEAGAASGGDYLSSALSSLRLSSGSADSRTAVAKKGGSRGKRAPSPSAAPEPTAIDRLAALDAAAAVSARSQLWQMAFSLYASRERLRLRHGDVKLLNFFLTGPDQVAAGVIPRLPSPAPLTDLQLRYGLGDDVYATTLPFPSPEGHGWVVKLADYGTASTDPASLDGPVRPHHFTTLENCPPEYLTEGDTARAGYGADAWALGLCGLHLLTGACPYEEWMAEAVCPPALASALRGAWAGPGFSVIAELVEGTEEEGGGGHARILADTLWRFAVLTGLRCGTGNADAAVECAWWPEPDVGVAPTPVWALLAAVTGPARPVGKKAVDGGRGGKGAPPLGGLAPAALAAAREAFGVDTARFCLAGGSHPLAVRARRRAQAAPGLLLLIRALLCWSPSSRPTMLAALTSPAFTPLRLNRLDCEGEEGEVARVGGAVAIGPSASAWRMPGAAGTVVLSYEAYDRRGADEGDSLENL
jgi:serine/threonine protein kinase